MTGSENTPPPPPKNTSQATMGDRPGGGERVVIVTGLSGAGKSTALHAFEDMGYEAVDNLPLVLLDRLVVDPRPQARKPLAVGIDIRTRDFDVRGLLAVIDRLRTHPDLDVDLLFLDADDHVLARRYTETRRRHPIGGDLPLTDGITLERQIVAALRDRADAVIDTSRLPVADFRALMEEQFGTEANPGMRVVVMSFGFRNGLPREADLVFDVRFLRNPHYVEDLRPKTGQSPDVGAYIAQDPALSGFLESLKTLIGPLLPRYEAEGKSYLTIAVGCTGGKHRSVYVAEQLFHWLEAMGRRPTLRHRDMPGTLSASGPTAGQPDKPGAETSTAIPSGQATGELRG